jgi:hypothetical protein
VTVAIEVNDVIKMTVRSEFSEYSLINVAFLTI